MDSFYCLLSFAYIADEGEQVEPAFWNLLFVATLIPFGTFVTDRRLAKISAN